MAELAKKLHFKKNGTEQTAKAYSTVDEAGDNYVPLKIDGVACYAPIGATNDAMATNGRVIKGGTAYAIKSQSKPAYTEISYTTAGTYTFTVPSGVTRMRVAVCGGGGGGALANNHTGGTGGTSKFGSLINATGGGGGTGATNSKTPVAGAGGSPNGRSGNAGKVADGTTVAGGAGFALSFTMANGTYGAGGSAQGASFYDDMNSFDYHPAGGGSGGYNSNYVSVTPLTTYSISVGGGGSASYGDRNDYIPKSGKSGFVLIAFGGDI